MSTAVGILFFISTCITPDNELLTVKYAFNLETHWDLNFQSLEIVYRGSEAQF